MMNKPKLYDVPNTETLGKRIFDFFDHYDDIKPQFEELKKLERKYPFFNVNSPTINYNGQIFDAYVRFHLDLKASIGQNDNYIVVDFNGGHNGMNLFLTPHRKIMDIEAQEKIYCDPELGYSFIKQYFFQNRRNYIKYMFNKNYASKHKELSVEQIEDIIDRETKKIFDDEDTINQHILIVGKDKSEDILIFDDHDKKHTAFRGWTGGYNPNYPEALNRGYMKLKSKWLGGGFNSLEKRINTLKQVFDDLVDLSQFEIQKSEIQKRELPNYQEIYTKLVKSDYYNEMIEFSKKLSKDAKISKKYDISVHIDGENPPTLTYLNEDNRIMFKTSFWKFDNSIGNCELHIPKELSGIKKDNRKLMIWTYEDSNRLDFEENQNTGNTNSKNVAITKYFKKMVDVSSALNYCFDKLKIKT